MSDIRLERLDALPAALAEISVQEIRSVFSGPSLIEIEGEIDDAPLFISTLLHGNETTSFEVLQHLQRACALAKPHRSLMIFVGNVEAAEQGLRHLDHAPDYNRIWAGGASPHHRLAQEVLALARQRRVFASVDIHNNTGDNPVYGCVNVLRPADLQLAEMASSVGVYYLNPPTTQSIAFSRICPAITMECGKPGSAEGFAAAVSLIDRVTRLDRFRDRLPDRDKLELYQTIGRVIVEQDAPIEFAEEGQGLALRPDLETRNFTRFRKDELWARTDWSRSLLRVVDEHGADLTDQFFRRDGDELRLARDIVPAMITRDIDIIRDDCLCYFMERI